MFSRCTNECNSIYALPFGVDFHESDQISAVLCAVLFMPNVTRIDSKCGKYGFMSRKLSMAFTASIFLKLTVTQFLQTSVPNGISSVRPVTTYPPAQRHIPVDPNRRFIYLCSVCY